MIFKATIKFYNDWANETEEEYSFVAAENFEDATAQIQGYYEDSLEGFELDAFAPDYMLKLGDKKMFELIADRLGREVIW